MVDGFMILYRRRKYRNGFGYIVMEINLATLRAHGIILGQRCHQCIDCSVATFLKFTEEALGGLVYKLKAQLLTEYCICKG